MEKANDNCASPAAATQAPLGVEAEFTLADRIGLDGKDGRDGNDGATIADARIDSRGTLQMTLSDGRSLNAGKAIARSPLAGIALPGTVPEDSSDPQVYFATQPGTYIHFPDSAGEPIVIPSGESINLFFRAGGSASWSLSATQTGNPFSGKRIVLFGDNNTSEELAEGAYTSRIRTKFDTDAVFKHGYLRSKYGSDGTMNNATLCDDTKLAAVTGDDPDMIFMMAGTFNYWSNSALGDYDGDISTEAYKKTTTGALRYILTYLQANARPECRIMICTPPPAQKAERPDTAPNTKGLTMTDYVARIKAVAEEFHTVVCDFWAEAGWSPLRESLTPKYTGSDWYLTAEGYERLTSLQYQTALRCFR